MKTLLALFLGLISGVGFGAEYSLEHDSRLHLTLSFEDGAPKSREVLPFWRRPVVKVERYVSSAEVREVSPGCSIQGKISKDEYWAGLRCGMTALTENPALEWFSFWVVRDLTKREARFERFEYQNPAGAIRHISEGQTESVRRWVGSIRGMSRVRFNRPYRLKKKGGQNADWSDHPLAVATHVVQAMKKATDQSHDVDSVDFSVALSGELWNAKIKRKGQTASDTRELYFNPMPTILAEKAFLNRDDRNHIRFSSPIAEADELEKRFIEFLKPKQ